MAAIGKPAGAVSAISVGFDRYWQQTACICD